MRNQDFEMAILLSKLMPKEMIVDKIKEHATNFSLTGNKQDEDQLHLYCMLFVTNSVPSSANELINKFHEFGKVTEQIEKSKSQ